MDWTNEQKQAIYEKNSNILVSAAAGSGKTAVLVERIINKVINENVDIDKILIVTFTNAAASEMRERILEAIYKKIEENPNNNNLQKQIVLLNKASICTIDSFCIDVIKNNFYEIDISPNFRIGDTSEIEILKYEVLEEIFEEKYEANDEDFIKLINTYTTYRDDTLLKNLILKIYTYIQSNPFPEKWLSEKVEMFNIGENLEEDFSKTVWGKILLEEFEEEIIDDILTLEKTKKDLNKYPELVKFYLTICDDINQLENIKNNLDSWNKTFEITNNLEFKKWPVDKKNTLEAKENAKKVRDIVKKKIKNKLNKTLVFNSKEANQDIYDMYDILSKLKDLIFEFGKRFEKTKKDKNMLDFNDIEHLALKILIKQTEDGKIQKTEVAKKYAQKFIEIDIDEYQDSNLVQEYILTSVSNNNNIFMVGDIKQSIYKFRQARPELFLNKYLQYKLKEEKTEKDNLKIQLFKNFRSRDNVLDFTNIIFENIMSGTLGDIEYNKEEFLNLGAKYENNNRDLKTEIDIIDLKEKVEDEDKKEEKEDSERIENVELEARFVANRIKELIDSNYKVFDAKKQEFRDLKYKDIVILLRSTKNSAPVYEKELLNLKLPVFSDTSSEYLDSIEIQTIMSLLKIIDNPLQDIPLVTVLRSSIGGFTDNDLIKIRLSDKYDNFYYTLIKAKLDVDSKLKSKIDLFLNNLESWRKEQEYLPLDELIWKIYIDTGYYNYVGLMPNGNLRQANLKMLFERAKQYEASSFNGLFNFINFIENLKLNNGDMGAAKLIGENEDVIRIMSIHKSKGLEFPVVILTNTGKQFNLMDLNNKLLLHQDIGIGVKYIDYDKQIEYDTLSKEAIKNKLYKETLSEEMRILYVALTRAKEKLIITGISKDSQKELEDMQEIIQRYSKIENKINPIVIKKYIKYLDWINLVYLYDDSLKQISNLNIYEKSKLLENLKNETEENNIDVLELINTKKEDKEKIESIKKLLEYNYKFCDAIEIPTKTSVTKIKELKNHSESKEKKYTEESNILNKPQFLENQESEKLTQAQKGTLVHLCLQKLDEKKDYKLEDIKKLIIDLVENEIITQKEADNININKVFAFTKSLIWNQLKNAKEVYKEKPFYINIPAKEIYDKDLTEKVLVQGIIDLYYIDKDNNLILVDYKTDYVENGNEIELVNRYRNQLELYKRALEKALNKKVYKVYIYSVYLEKEIEL